MPVLRLLPLLLALGVAACAEPGAAPLGEATPDTTAPASAMRAVADSDTVVARVALDTIPKPELPEGFVRLSEVEPSIGLEIRYTTAYNFVGAPIDGYVAPECILTVPAARALGRAARDLARQGLGLKVYDCYRPQQAVDHFVRWIRRPDDQAMKAAFYPDEPKHMLVRRGYISTRSGHSRGSTVDLTLVRLPAAVRARDAFPPDSLAPPCTAPRGERLDEQDLDMGTAYDCLSPLAATASRRVSAEARSNRRTLADAMSRAGFRNYTKEWWHYTLRGEPHTGRYFDFPVE